MEFHEVRRYLQQAGSNGWAQGIGAGATNVERHMQRQLRRFRGSWSKR